MPHPAVARNVFQAYNILRNTTAKRSFDLVIPIDDLADPADFVFGQFARLLFGTSTPTIRGIITPVLTKRYSFSSLALTLLMTRIRRTNHTQNALATDDFALFTNSFD